MNATTTNIVTYRFAYVTGSVSLCKAHAATEKGLGHVLHGERKGLCDRCIADHEAAIDAFEREIEAEGNRSHLDEVGVMWARATSPATRG